MGGSLYIRFGYAPIQMFYDILLQIGRKLDI